MASESLEESRSRNDRLEAEFGGTLTALEKLTEAWSNGGLSTVTAAPGLVRTGDYEWGRDDWWRKRGPQSEAGKAQCVDYFAFRCWEDCVLRLSKLPPENGWDLVPPGVWIDAPPWSLLRRDVFRDWEGREPNAAERALMERLEPRLINTQFPLQLNKCYRWWYSPVQAGIGGALHLLAQEQQAEFRGWFERSADDVGRRYRELEVPNVPAGLLLHDPRKVLQTVFRLAIADVQRLLTFVHGEPTVAFGGSDSGQNDALGWYRAEPPVDHPTNTLRHAILNAALRLLQRGERDLLGEPEVGSDWYDRWADNPVPVDCSVSGFRPTVVDFIERLKCLPHEDVVGLVPDAEDGLDLVRDDVVELADLRRPLWGAWTDLLSRSVSTRRRALELAGAVGLHPRVVNELFDRNTFFPFDPLDAALVAKSPGDGFFQFLDDQPYNVPVEMAAAGGSQAWLTAVERDLEHFSSLHVLLGSPAAAPRTVGDQELPRRRIQRLLPSPMARWAQKACDPGAEPGQGLQNVIQLLMATLRVLGAIAAASLRGRGTPGRGDLAGLLRSPAEGTWLDLVKAASRGHASYVEHRGPLSAFFAGAHWRDLQHVLSWLIELRNRHAHETRPPATQLRDELAQAQVKVRELLAALERTFQSACLVVMGPHRRLPGRHGSWQRVTALRGLAHPPFEFDLPADPPFLPSGDVSLLSVADQALISLDPFLRMGELKGLLTWSRCTANGLIELGPLDEYIGNEKQKERLDERLWATPAQRTELSDDVVDRFERELGHFVSVDEDERLAGRFTIGKLVGTGGFGCVYRALDGKHEQQEVALKLLHPYLAEDRASLARFKAEAKHQRGMTSDHVVRVHELGEDPERGLHFLVMELADGGSLRDRLRDEPIDQATQDDVALAMASALADVHDSGLTHRDVTPDNVLRVAGRWKLGDFGLAFDVERGRMTRCQPVLPPRAYTPPEYFRSEPSPSFDVYGFGRLLLAMQLGGDPPERGPQRWARDARWTPLGRACTATDPAKRPADGRALLEQVRTALAEGPPGPA